jgi:hypothetical protein
MNKKTGLNPDEPSGHNPNNPWILGGHCKIHTVENKTIHVTKEMEETVVEKDPVGDILDEGRSFTVRMLFSVRGPTPWQFSVAFLWRTPCEVFPNSVQGSRFKVQTVRRGGGKGCTLFHWRLHWQCPAHYYRRLTVKGKVWVSFIYFEFVNNIVLTFDLLEGVRETSYSYSNFSVKIIFFSFEPLDPPNMTKTTVGQTIVRRRYTPVLWRSRIWTW